MEQFRKADRLLLGVIHDTLRCGLSGILTKERKKASPSAKYFWSARIGPVKKVRGHVLAHYRREAQQPPSSIILLFLLRCRAVRW
jgi:hypothetical protein